MFSQLTAQREKPPPPYPGPPDPSLGNESLPSYSNSIYLAARVPLKSEFIAPHVIARDRRWKKVWVVLDGTALKVYRDRAGFTWGSQHDSGDEDTSDEAQSSTNSHANPHPMGKPSWARSMLSLHGTIKKKVEGHSTSSWKGDPTKTNGHKRTSSVPSFGQAGPSAATGSRVSVDASRPSLSSAGSSSGSGGANARASIDTPSSATSTSFAATRSSIDTSTSARPSTSSEMHTDDERDRDPVDPKFAPAPRVAASHFGRIAGKLGRGKGREGEPVFYRPKEKTSTTTLSHTLNLTRAHMPDWRGGATRVYSMQVSPVWAGRDMETDEGCSAPNRAWDRTMSSDHMWSACARKASSSCYNSTLSRRCVFTWVTLVLSLLTCASAGRRVG